MNTGSRVWRTRKPWEEFLDQTLEALIEIAIVTQGARFAGQSSMINQMAPRVSSSYQPETRKMVRPARFELAAPRLGGGCSIP